MSPSRDRATGPSHPGVQMQIRYVDIDDRMEDLADRMRDDPEVAEEFQRKYELSWLYHENALEGLVYSGEELAAALAAPTLTDATFASALQETRNHKIALDIAREEATAKKLKFNLTIVKRLHEALNQGIEERIASDHRKDTPRPRAHFP